MIQIVCQNAVGSTATIVVGFLVADKHVKRLFLLRNGKNTLLNFVNCFGFFLVKRFLIAVCILQGRFIIIIIKD